MYAREVHHVQAIFGLTLKENTSWYFFSWVWPFRRIPEWVPHWTCLGSLGKEGAGTGPTTSSPPGWHRNPAQRSKVSSSSGWHSRPSNPRRTACNGGNGPIRKNVVFSITVVCSTSLNSKEIDGVFVHAHFYNRDGLKKTFCSLQHRQQNYKPCTPRNDRALL